ncbi:hypothetical protein ACHAXA_006704 [Cyclostephanos tholiformis]|uniref:Glycosyl transferase CAP10 domain-containing protein n=1 Tax=Cyclostephanos tholiformis TaxID=382380 RepID=A0ABD3SRB1_9STRA
MTSRNAAECGSTTTTNTHDHHPRRHRRRTTALVAISCAAVALCVQRRALRPGPRGDDVVVDRIPGGGAGLGIVGLGDNHRRTQLRTYSARAYENDDDMGRGVALPPLAVPTDRTIPRPLPGLVDDGESNILSHSRGGIDVEGVDAGADADDSGAVTHAQLIDEGLPLPPYAIDDAIRTSRMYDNTYALLVYDPEKDTFYLLYSKRHNWVNGCNKLLISFNIITFFMRRSFPERFQGSKSDELVIPISSGDYPSVRVECLDHFREQRGNDWINGKSKATCGDGNPAPILHFGSVFRQPHMFPNMIGMPMPAPEHLYCLEKWVIHREVCPELRARSASDVDGELVYGEEVGLAWEDLIPQVVWRGTDFSYLTRVYPTLRKPIFTNNLFEWPTKQEEEDQRTNKIFGRMTALKAAIVKRRLDRVRKRAPRRADQNIGRLRQFNKAAAVKAMREQYDLLVPRWKAVVLTGEAEVDAAAAYAASPDGDATLPWANMKFSTFVGDGGHKTHSEGSDIYKDWESIGFPATGEYMSLLDLARYKYHIDLGGGGGTTWTGTLQKLALPGLLFHHMTPTKDYIHDYMRPWVHYIPVSSDLHDLKRKYDWSESNPVEARQIAEAGTNLARHLTSRGGLEDTYNRDVVEPLRRVIEAYQPISIVHGQGRVTWRHWWEAVRQIEDDHDVLLPIYECESWTPRTCQPLQGRNWWEKTFSVDNKRKRFG